MKQIYSFYCPGYDLYYCKEIVVTTERKRVRCDFCMREDELRKKKVWHYAHIVPITIEKSVKMC